MPASVRKQARSASDVEGALERPGEERIEGVDDDVAAAQRDERQARVDEGRQHHLGELQAAGQRRVEEVAAGDVGRGHQHHREQHRRRDGAQAVLEPARRARPHGRRRRRSARRDQASKVAFMIRSVRRKSRARRASPASIGLTPPTAAASICSRAMRSMKTARKVASWMPRPADELAVVREQHRVLRAQAPGNQLAFAVGGRQAGPVGEKGDVVEERRRIHVGDDQRLAGGGERRGRRRMGVHDRRHVGAGAVDPEVKARRRIRLADAEGAFPLEHSEVVVDEQPGRFLGLVEGQAERQRPERAVARTARRQLAREARLVAFVGEDPGRARERASRIGGRSFAGGDPLQLFVELGVHLGAVDALGVGRLDPRLGQRLGALLHVGDEGRAGLRDLARWRPSWPRCRPCRPRPRPCRRAAPAPRPTPTGWRPGPAWAACPTCPGS